VQTLSLICNWARLKQFGKLERLIKLLYTLAQSLALEERPCVGRKSCLKLFHSLEIRRAEREVRLRTLTLPHTPNNAIKDAIHDSLRTTDLARHYILGKYSLTTLCARKRSVHDHCIKLN
jgi:hypothetical protein